eukprot:TRINITY_DN5484_c0_g1_i1.p1 TRINITY_DN5484_c0_g1~~TRINITY_DN5484_c0_g1_i1.p1  ORF type:complete len:129 (+),score=23.12 TRINITY_DN5484_c0_g1_i1:69-455(+)
MSNRIALGLLLCFVLCCLFSDRTLGSMPSAVGTGSDASAKKVHLFDGEDKNGNTENVGDVAQSSNNNENNNNNGNAPTTEKIGIVSNVGDPLMPSRMSYFIGLLVMMGTVLLPLFWMYQRAQTGRRHS